MSLHADFTARRGTFEVDVALDVADGETLALLGPNGAGKSTVVDALGGHARRRRGDDRARRRTRSIDLPPEQRPVGVCFQDDLLFPQLSALENVAFPLRARKVAEGQPRARAPRNCSSDSLRRSTRRERPGRCPAASAARRAGPRAGARAAAAAAGRAVRQRGRLGAARRCGRWSREVASTFGGARVLVAHDPLDALTLADRVTLMEAGPDHAVRHARGDPRSARDRRTPPTWWA